MGKITVYAFKVLDVNSGEYRVAPRAGTRQAIVRAQGEILEHSAWETDYTELDGNGLVKTGRPLPAVKAALFCREVIEDKNGVLSLIQVVDRYTAVAPASGSPEKLPRLPIDVAFVLMTEGSEFAGKHSISLTISAPSGRTLIDAAYPDQDFVAGRGLNVIMRFRVVINEEGIHEAAVRLDGQALVMRPLEMRYLRTSAPDENGVAETGQQ